MGEVSRRILGTDSGLSEFYFSKKGMKQNKAKYTTQTPTVTTLSIPEERINTKNNKINCIFAETSLFQSLKIIINV